MGTRLKFINHQNLPLNSPIIFISNHQSMYDIPGLIWYLRNYNPKFVSKMELGKGIPSISYNLRKSGAALIDRAKPEQALIEIERFGEFIAKNSYSICLFPEGTRSKNGIMKPFTSKGFLKLVDCIPNALVVPIAIHNSWKFTQYGAFPMSFGERIIWKVLTPISENSLSPSEKLRFAEKAIHEDLGQ